jgi:hypothetical protein
MAQTSQRLPRLFLRLPIRLIFRRKWPLSMMCLHKGFCRACGSIKAGAWPTEPLCCSPRRDAPPAPHTQTPPDDEWSRLDLALQTARGAQANRVALTSSCCCNNRRVHAALLGRPTSSNALPAASKAYRPPQSPQAGTLQVAGMNELARLLAHDHSRAHPN